MRGTAGSVILEVARLPAMVDPASAFPTSDELDHWNYWRREALAYEIAACGAAKYSWFARAIVGRAAHDHTGSSSFGQDTSAAAAARRVTGLVTLIAD